MLSATLRFGDDVCDSTGLRGSIRRHPLAAMTLGLAFGAWGGPALARRLQASRLPAIALAKLAQLATRP